MQEVMGRRRVIGLLGGGQLGRMLREAASPVGIEVAVLDAESSSARLVHTSRFDVTGSFKDRVKIRELATRSDSLTVEIEHVDTEVLEEIERDGVEIELDGRTITHHPPVNPSWRSIRLIQDKYLQKEHFRANKVAIPVVDQMAVESGAATRESLREAANKFGFPFMLKARKGSYDGRGNFKVRSEDDFEAAMTALGKLPLYAEKWAPFVKELAVMVIRTEDGDGNLRSCVPYPAVETVHEDSICTKTFMPPRGVGESMCRKARELACHVISTLWGKGVFAVEMFLLEDESLLVNEVAPRPHNSGHYTIEAVPHMSQFTAQLHAILDLPVDQDIHAQVSSSIMVNILGGATPSSHDALLLLARARHAGMFSYLHLYDKDSKPGRKIGHITLTSQKASIEKLEKMAEPFIKLADEMREERLKAAIQIIRPQQESSKPGSGSTAFVHLPTPDVVSQELNKGKVIQAAEPAHANSISKPASCKKARQASGLSTRKNTPLANNVALHQATCSQPVVLVTMGSDSDLPVLEAGLNMLREFSVPFITRITSAHRTPNLMMQVAGQAAADGFKVIIAAAGGAAHLPGMAASETPLPVIGVPVKASVLGGVDSLYSIVQMPRGIPCATVGINNSTNAALLAIRILGTSIPRYQDEMVRYQESMEREVLIKDERIRHLGAHEYLAAWKGAK